MRKSIFRTAMIAGLLISGASFTNAAQAQTVDLVNAGQDVVYTALGSGLSGGLGAAGDPLGDLLPAVNDLGLTGASPLATLLPPLLDGEVLGPTGLPLAPLVSGLTMTLGNVAAVPELTDTLAVTNNILLPILGGR